MSGKKGAVQKGRRRPFQYRVRYIENGGHVHCRVFSRPKGQDTWAKCGDLVVCCEEFMSFQTAFFAAEFLEEPS